MNTSVVLPSDRLKSKMGSRVLDGSQSWKTTLNSKPELGKYFTVFPKKFTDIEKKKEGVENHDRLCIEWTRY